VAKLVSEREGKGEGAKVGEDGAGVGIFVGVKVGFMAALAPNIDAWLVEEEPRTTPRLESATAPP